MQLSKQQAAELCRKLGFEQLAFDKSDPDFKLLSAVQHGLDTLHECTLEALLRLVPDRFQLGELKPADDEAKQQLKQVLKALNSNGGWFRVQSPPVQAALSTVEEVARDEEYEKLLAQLKAVDAQSDRWEEIAAAGEVGITILDRFWFCTGASTDLEVYDGRIIRRPPPADARDRAFAILNYWSVRSQSAEQSLEELQMRHFRRTTAPSAAEFKTAKEARTEVKHCRKMLAEARKRVDEPNKPKPRSLAEVEMEAAFEESNREAISQMEDLLRV